MLALEIGVGSGIISAALAKAVPQLARMDVNPDACCLAMATAMASNVAERFYPVWVNGVNKAFHFGPLAGKVDIVLCNLPYVFTDERKSNITYFLYLVPHSNCCRTPRGVSKNCCRPQFAASLELLPVSK